MQFTYRFSSRWCVDYSIEINSQQSGSNVTYVSDCLGDLLRALMDLNADCVPEGDNLMTETSCLWNSEPLITTWSFSLKRAGLLHVVVSQEYSAANEDGTYAGIQTEIDIDTECSYDYLLEVIIKEADVLLKKHGIVGYQQNWDHEFPLSTFLKLKNYLLNKKPYVLIEIGDDYGEIKAGNVKSDIDLLFKEVPE
ncbi:hypothetical protein [Domibacillus indicus]|uniref:hypothetical protein n=1 Tax=Domibacillus indicus TaxID=1437523 RepID=UPI000617AE9A|nr:hypothetical protein [Domibacillus indicus]